MGRLRTAQWSCTQYLDAARGVCCDQAVIRCNACRKEFCQECWEFHYEMTVVMEVAQGPDYLEGMYILATGDLDGEV